MTRRSHTYAWWFGVALLLAKLVVDQAIPSGGIGGTLLVLRGLERRGVLPGRLGFCLGASAPSRRRRSPRSA